MIKTDLENILLAVASHEKLHNKSHKLCASCDEIRWDDDSKKFKPDEFPLIMWEVLKVTSPKYIYEYVNSKIQNCYDVAELICSEDIQPMFNNILLASRGVYANLHKDLLYFDFILGVVNLYIAIPKTEKMKQNHQCIRQQMEIIWGIFLKKYLGKILPQFS